MIAPADILGANSTSLGALLVGIGAILLLVDALAGSGFSGMTWGGTLPQPTRRLSSGAEVAGAIFVAGGSALLLLGAKGLSLLAVVISLVAAALIIYVVMTFRLREHMNLIAKENDGAPHRSWWWCARHPGWRPSPKADHNREESTPPGD
jgi:hypothetical protein